MEHIRLQYKKKGLVAMLQAIQQFCNLREEEKPMPCTSIRNQLHGFVSVLCPSFCRDEPLLKAIGEAFQMIDTALERKCYSIGPMLIHMETLFHFYISCYFNLARNNEEYEIARLLTLSFIYHTFNEYCQISDMMNVLAEEAVRNIKGEPSLLSLYHTTWCAMMEASIIRPSSEEQLEVCVV